MQALSVQKLLALSLPKCLMAAKVSQCLIITAEFNPAFQLGHGFSLIGVGGLLGLNRTVLKDPLRDGVRTGAVNNIGVSQNVVANAPRIISDLKIIFSSSL